jgi:hypothetical protein
LFLWKVQVGVGLPNARHVIIHRVRVTFKDGGDRQLKGSLFGLLGVVHFLPPLDYRASSATTSPTPATASGTGAAAPMDESSRELAVGSNTKIRLAWISWARPELTTNRWRKS